ncbi:HAD family hydrolase [Paenibacillus sp. GD4]|uniref:HAD family hydrolase n=1 Tax=Paenibacillus sp. GD4 TaxID=3068890 RepID=UPI00279644ED|nr:HAD family hydrolase [Paenibacillus sp. GD4]MDQ1911642.1 HAD family hydrolase [Paenibacillus sp. GD4]
MSYNGLLLDIDNTLYEYEPVHQKALQSVIGFLSEQSSIKNEILYEYYNIAKNQIHIELHGTAASHNRLLYFQRLFELLGKPSMPLAGDAYEVYWSTFITHMTFSKGVIEFFQKSKNSKICLVTDLTADVQFKKIKKLQLDKYCQYVVTSEEAGVEKPHPYIFLLALKKLGMTPDEVCMIGDSYKKDIVGASELGIKNFWISPEKPKVTVPQNTTVVSKFEEIVRYI